MIDATPQQVCIAKAVYHEARGESELGQAAVAHVIINRSKDRGLKPCAVIRQPGQFRIKFQKNYKGEAWDKALSIVTHLVHDPTKGALFFRNLRSVGDWPYELVRTIGHHRFYK